MAHLAPAARARYLATLSPGDDIDHCGTTFTDSLLNDLLHVLRDPTSSRPHLGGALFDGVRFSADARFDGATFSADATFSGATFSATARFGGATFSGTARFGGATFSDTAWFGGATFSGTARFGGATFSDTAWFDGATFSGTAWFDGATFSDTAWFDGATFSDTAWFDGATFSDSARFGGATFSGTARFGGATFSADARFGGATFSGIARFGGATFSADARFDGATFSAATLLGPLVCHGRLDLSGAAFVAPVTIEAAAAKVRCVRTRWESTAALRLRYAEVDLSDAVVTQPIAVIAHTALFATGSGTVVDETALTDTAGVQLASGVSISSLRGVDAAHLVLTNMDLTGCRFFGAFHLDQLRLEGETVFARTPVGTDVRRGIPLRWTDRLALAEEHHWRALPDRRPSLRAGWTPAPPQPGPAACPPGPPALAALYRQLRKAFEDGKDEPGAADFYYAEMEMRRLDRRPRRNQAERGLLTAYWALSGYGLRASRALAWLLLAMTATVLAMMLWGLPADDPKPESTGKVTGQDIRLTTDTPAPVNPSGPLHERVSTKRFEKSLRVVVNSVVFRSSGQNLTTRGTYTEMASRLAEPILLGFAALAIRGRVKR
ncbi:pentapeptide repeat-containing protein [Streptomyces sp. NPDC002701]|uniref:pentapeptide repeat-containing protein n=1 Tax=Streptomyces sp. NPDC002701 TaxID=3364661 RepID=UPI0036C154BB